MTDSSAEDSLQRTTTSTTTSPTTTVLGLFSRTDQDLRLVGQQLLLRGPGVLDRRPDVGHVESHITSETVQLRRPEQSVNRHTTVGDLGKAHRIHAVVNNHQAEHQSTVLETSGTIVDQTFSILIDPGATERFISSATLKIIKVKESSRTSLDT
jgi:hypothetical protein